MYPSLEQKVLKMVGQRQNTKLNIWCPDTWEYLVGTFDIFARIRSKWRKSILKMRFMIIREYFVPTCIYSRYSMNPINFFLPETKPM